MRTTLRWIFLASLGFGFFLVAGHDVGLVKAAAHASSQKAWPASLKVCPPLDAVSDGCSSPVRFVRATEPGDSGGPTELGVSGRLPGGSPPPGPAGPPMGSEYFFAGGQISSSPKPIRLDGDPRPGIVFGNSLGQIYVLTADGVVAPGWPVTSDDQAGFSSAAVVDLDGDGSEDIVFHVNSQLQAYAQDGSMLPGWPQGLDQGVTGNSVIASPAVADIDDDGDLEVLIGHFWSMYAFHHDGTSVAGWPILQDKPFGPLFSTPAVGDLDGDGDAEICFKIYGGNGDPADIHLLHHDGTPLPGWPKLGLDRSHLSSPAFADIDGDGGPEIVISLHFFDSGNYVRTYVWRPDGTDLVGFPVVGEWNTAPANNSVGDIDGDGMLEIFVATSHYTAPFYAVHAWNHDGSVLAGSWPRSAPECLLHASAALADIDGGQNEVIVGVGGCYVDDMGNMNAWDTGGAVLPTWPRTTMEKMESSPLVMDADNDGIPEIYVGTTDGWVHRFLTHDATGGDLPEWNQIFHDSRNTNLYQPPAQQFERGDSNGDGSVDIADGIFLLDFLFVGGEPLACDDAGDANDDGAIDLGDAVGVLNFLFVGGDIPPPSAGCGSDPTSDGLDCGAYDACP